MNKRLRDRILKLIRYYRFEIAEGKFLNLEKEINTHFMEDKRKRKWGKFYGPKTIVNEKRFYLIQEAQRRLNAHPYYIPEEATATVITEIISHLRSKTILFKDFCEELWDISQLSSFENVKKNMPLDLIPKEDAV